EPRAARRVVLSSLPFILGFTVVFVVLGAAAAAIGGVVNPDRQLEIAGFVLVVLGLVFMGLLPWPERVVAPGLLTRSRRTGSSVRRSRSSRSCASSGSSSPPRCVGAYGDRRRCAFSSCRSIPIRRPRPAWYHATATCTSPCRKSRSSGGAARQASSSSSCAAKYSPARISSRPASNPDADLSVGDLHVVGLELNREVELVFPGAHVVLP